MTRFLDGPAQGVTLLLRRAPHFLRAVKAADWDALDQLGDRPRADEQVVVYEMRGEPSWMHIRATKGGGIYRGGEYVLVEPQPTDDVLRDEAKWQDWAAAAFRERTHA